MSSWRERQVKARAWSLIGHYIDLKNLQEVERIEALQSAAILTAISKDMEKDGALATDNEASRLLDQQIEELTGRKTVLNKKLFPPQ
jgi:hypothetical protein